MIKPSECDVTEREQMGKCQFAAQMEVDGIGFEEESKWKLRESLWCLCGEKELKNCREASTVNL